MRIKIIFVVSFLAFSFSLAQENLSVEDRNAEFPGGIKIFVQQVVDNLKMDSISGEGQLKTKVSFTVNKEGSISKATAIGNNESFNQEVSRAVKSIATKWIPAVAGGKEVGNAFTLPITINLLPEPEKIYTGKEVTKEASYPKGGINGFRRDFQNMINLKNMDGLGTVGAELSFVVDTEGRISDVEAIGFNDSVNKEAIKALKNIRDRWIPAEIDGQKVKSRFTFPITMSFIQEDPTYNETLRQQSIFNHPQRSY